MSDNDNTTMETKPETSTRKRVRHRKKQLYEKIIKQMEFYFSDANLSKDRFLGELISADPYVPLDTFLKFNKIRAMTHDIVDIGKAVKNSPMLELSEDKTKVKRKSPLLPYDADARTVYVESIPVTASREWLEGVFRDYGAIAYISLPKFKNSQRIKGYAFIEFVTPEGAQKCLYAFTKMGCKLPTCMAPEDLSTIKLFNVDEPSVETQNENANKKVEKALDDSYEPPKKKTKKNKEKKPHKNVEAKVDADQESEAEKKSDSFTEDVGKPMDESKDEASGQDETGKLEDGSRKKKRRKRPTKDRNKQKSSLNINEAPKGALWGLQILSKPEWKALRNKYLNLQRKHMKELKKDLRASGHSLLRISVPSIEMEQNISQKEIEPNKSNSAPLNKVPGVFVKVKLQEPCLDVRLTKKQVRSNVHVQHVDLKEGQTEMIIRFDSAEAANQYCSSGIVDCARVLNVTEEAEQWARAEAARTDARRVRGRCRLLAKAEAATTGSAPAPPQPTATHLRFDDENN